MSRLLVATRNSGKVRELREMLASSRIQLETFIDHPDVADVEETASSFEGNAALKARHAALATGLWALADDSGLEVDALDGAPGVHSARYAGTHGDDAANNAKLIDSLVGVRNRSARFVCVTSLANPAGELMATARGVIEGEIIDAACGVNGFGYDPHFRPVGEDRTMAELDPLEKAKISHRGQAIRAILPEIQRRVGGAQ